MSKENTPQPQPSGSRWTASSHQSSVPDRIDNLCRVVSQLERNNNRRRRMYVVLGLLVMTLSAFGFATLTSKVFQLDAKALSQLGRIEVERRLPDGVQSLKMYLAGQAPHFVSQTMRSLLNSIPAMRHALVNQLENQTEAAMKEFERTLVEEITRVIHSTKADIDKVAATESDVKKIDLLVREVTETFNQGVDVALDELYPHYSSEMGRIRAFLVDLNTKDPQQLTPREKIQKELIQTLLELIDREGASL